MNLRKLAKGRECQIRLPFVCSGNPESVVLAHFRMIGMSGIGLKSPDWLGAHACALCHAYVDTHKDAETQLAFAKGCFRTQAFLLKKGLIQITKGKS